MKLKEKLTPQQFGLDYDRPRDFVTLQWGRPRLYLVWSTIWTIYHLIWLCIDGYFFTFKVHPEHRGKWLVYLTNWSYLLLTLHAFLDFMIACNAHFLDDLIIKGRTKHMPVIYKVSWVMFNVSNTSGVLLMLTYWIKLAMSTTATSVNKHGINAIYIVLCVLVTAKPIKFQHFYQPMIFTFTYILFLGIHAAVTGTSSVYSFIDWREKPAKTFGLCFAYIFLCVPVIHCAIFGLFCLRCFLVNKLRKKSTLSKHERNNENNMDRNEILKNDNTYNNNVC